jgi:hypothetical protein
VPRKTFHADVPLCGRGEQRGLIDSGRQQGERIEPGSDALDAGVRKPARERVEQGVTASAVLRTHAA